jgi:DNA repair ATPase RecN
MSWSSFKKSVSRSTTQIMQKAGAVDKTVDRSFDEEEKRIRNLQSKVEKLQKEAKGYLSALKAVTSAQVRIAETIEQLYESSNDDRNLAGSRYKSAILQFDNESKSILVRQNIGACMLLVSLTSA